ncbi:MAG: LysE family transporter [Candidatus Hodarchaeota archaeon]
MSGALAPGPLLFTNLSNASRWGWKGGVWLSIGHTVVEFPVILLITYGLSYLIYIPFLQFIISLLGGFVLLVVGIFQLHEALKSFNEIEDGDLAKLRPTRHPFMIGLAFSALNPFFLVWWFTVGASLVLIAWLFASVLGVLVMFASHVWIDYVWLAGTAWLTEKGMTLVSTKGYRILLGGFGLLLAFFGIQFCFNALLLLNIF